MNSQNLTEYSHLYFKIEYDPLKLVLSEIQQG